VVAEVSKAGVEAVEECCCGGRRRWPVTTFMFFGDPKDPTILFVSRLVVEATYSTPGLGALRRPLHVFQAVPLADVEVLNVECWMSDAEC